MPWSLFVNASLKNSFYWCIPVACQRAVEAEFNKKVWALVIDKVGRKNIGNYKNVLSINRICEILTAKEKKNLIENALVKALQKEIQQLIKDAAIPDNIQKLKMLKVDSTDARHGSLGDKAYSKERLIKFAQKVELYKPDGWIFRWLEKSSCIR